MLKLFLILTGSLVFGLSVSGKQNIKDTIPAIEIVSVPTKLIIDTLKIHNLEGREMPKNWYENKSLPWITAIFISVLGILFNLLISKNQIKANKESILRQIKGTLSTNNRQEWITETRNAIVDLMTQANLLNIEFQEENQDIVRKKSIHEKVTMNRTKLLLLLKPDKEKHEILKESLISLINTLDEHFYNRKALDENNIVIPYDNGKFLSQMDKVILDGRDLLYDEWRTIQSITDNV